MLKVLLTGASGRIGRALFEASSGRYAFVLVDRQAPDFPIDEPHRFQALDLSDRTAVLAAIRGIDAVVHLAAVPDPDATFDEILPNNILATTHVIEAAAKSRCRRFVFASSAQTIEGYAVDRQVTSGMPVSPANLYGVSKCYGEALCALYARKHGLSSVAIRIGAFERAESPNLTTTRDLSAWLSPADAVHLLQRAVEAEGVDFLIAHGVSNNRFKRLDLTETCRVLGYEPQDDAFATFDMPIDRLPGGRST